MNKTDLREMTEKWMGLERKTVKQREAANQFYEKNLLKLIQENFVLRNKEVIQEKTEYLIMSVGTSYEPLVLSISLLRPKKILFLCTDVTETYLDKIVKYCNLLPSTFQKTIVDETNPVSIYHEIKKSYLQWGKPEKLFIDFTGGTKAMSAAAAMAGAMIKVQLLYVGCQEYLVDFRKPKPGTETLYFITNPLEVFGDLEIEKAFTLFQKHNYAGARLKLMELKEEVPMPGIRQQLEFAYLLASIYEHWDALEFPEAYENIVKLNKLIKRDHLLNDTFLLMDFLSKLRYQEDILYQLNEISILLADKKREEVLMNDTYMFPLMFSMLQNASIREEQEKYDMATLLLYRLLEMIEQCSLIQYQLYVSKMDYSKMKYPENYVKKEMANEELFKILKERYLEIKKELFGKTGSAYLPDQVSLLEGFIILAALDDKIVTGNNGRSIDKLKRIRAMVYLRNNSIFAHELGAVGKEDFLKFKQFVTEIFMEFCTLRNVNFREYIENISWIDPFQSKHYAGMEGH